MKTIKPKDIQRIIASTNAQTASIEIVELFTNWQKEQDEAKINQLESDIKYWTSEANRCLLEDEAKIESQKQIIKEMSEALNKITKNYDNVEDLAGVVARTTLDKYNNYL